MEPSTGLLPLARIGGNKVLTGSQIGGIAETQEMLDFVPSGLGATIGFVDASDPPPPTSHAAWGPCRGWGRVLSVRHRHGDHPG